MSSRPKHSEKDFVRRLGRQRGTWLRGLSLAVLFSLLGALLAAVVIYGLADYFLALDNRSRMIIGVLIAGAALAWLVISLTRILSLDRAAAARRADELLGDRRQSVLSAWELSESGELQNAPQDKRYLIEASVGEANDALAALPWTKVAPLKKVGTQFGKLALLAVVLGLFVAAVWAVAAVIAPRIFQPWRDLPPYSPYRFAITPGQPEVLYGENTGITVEISGAPIEGPVWFMTRDQRGEVFRSLCFQEGPGKFSQNLEKVTQPVEVAFGIGKARSEWRPVELLLQPKVALARATLTPPEYSKLPESEFLVGAEPFEGLKRSKVRLDVVSNRPLQGGTLTIRDARNADREQVIAGESTAVDTVSFEWQVENEAYLEVSISDVRGAVIDEPYRIYQRLRPDHPPQLTVEEPPVFMLATPGVKVPVRGSAVDDLGLDRVELVRTVVGYRDRMRRVDPGTVPLHQEVGEVLDLEELGVAAGDELELYLEAGDTNPSLMGIAASSVARIRVISEKDYAAMLRNKVTVREFSERYRIVDEQLRHLQEVLEALKGAPTDAAKLAEARQAAAQAAELFRRLAGDFAAYDFEQGLIDQAKVMQDLVEAIAEQLKKGSPSPEALAQMLEQLGVSKQEVAQQRQQAEDIAAMAKLMQAAAKFSTIVREQGAHERRLQLFQEGATQRPDAARLKAHGQSQEKIHQQLNAFEVQISEAAEGLPENAAEMKQSALAFLKALRKTRAGEDMQRSVSEAGTGNGASSHQFARLARDKLDALLDGSAGELGEEGQNFAGMCRGRGEFPGQGDLQSTLEQMLGAIGMRGGNDGFGGSGFSPGGRGMGGGGSVGGDSNDGYATSGYSQLDVPMMGPERMHLQSPQDGGQAGTGDGDGRGRGADRAGEISERDRLQAQADAMARARVEQMERLPEKYRSAVKTYFSAFENASD